MNIDVCTINKSIYRQTYIYVCVFRLLLASNPFDRHLSEVLVTVVAEETKKQPFDGFHRAAWPTQTTERTIDTSVTIVHKARNPYEPPRKTQHIPFYGLVERDIYNGSL